MQRSSRYVRTAEDFKPVLGPALEKPLLSLHRAMDVSSFWKATRQLLSVALPNCLIGLTFQRHPALRRFSRWTGSVPADFFVAEPLKSYLAGGPRKTLVLLRELFPSRSSFLRSLFYSRYFVPQKCGSGVLLFFWRRQRLICSIAILRPVREGDFSQTHLKLLRHLYPQLMTALCRIEALERERSVLVDVEKFLGRLPLPTIILRWNLKPIYLNRAAREFCAVWEKGPEEAKRTKPSCAIPNEILERCRRLRQQWLEAERYSIAASLLREEQVRHPRLSHLRATIRLRHLKSARVARPHFLIECEDLSRNGSYFQRASSSVLPALARLTIREQEVARLVCTGQSNKEIASATHLSLAMVKKHLHAIFRKLQVPSRSRLVALML
jgi:DNA-binding CsgD family transcriptional regulator